MSSWWVNLHGHSNPTISEAIAKQAQTLEQVIFAGFTHKPALKLSDNLLSVLPKNQSKIFFSDNGSTSVEVALKIAIQYWHNLKTPRKKIIAIEGAYHGDTFGAMAVAERNMFSAPFDDRLFEVQFIPFPEGDGKNTIEAFRTIADEDAVAFIFEPLVQGAGGMRIYDPNVLNELLEIATKNDIITIADEVMVGFYRTGRFFASDYLNIKPNIFCLSKGLTGGFMPMSITSVSHDIVDAFNSDSPMNTFWHGHSYTANPLACAAANASFDILMNEGKDQVAEIDKSHQKFRKMISKHPNLEQVRSLGTILSLTIKADDSGYSSSIRNRIYNYFLKRDILLRPLGNVLYFMPPYVIEKTDLERVYAEIKTFIDSL